MANGKKIVLVTGDFLIDHHIYEGRRHQFAEHSQPGVRVVEELGGAALVQRLTAQLAPQLAAKLNAKLDAQLAAQLATKPDAKLAAQFAAQRDAKREIPPDSVLAIGEAAALKANHASGPGSAPKPFGSYASWRMYKDKEAKEAVWRAAQSMGFSGEAADANSWPWQDAVNLPDKPDVLVIADGGMGFRARMNAGRWRIPVRDAKFLSDLEAAYEKDKLADRIPVLRASLAYAAEPAWIVLKTSAPLAQGDLWRELVTHHEDHLITVVSASELRLAGVGLGYGLSWEQSLEELHRELESHPTLAALKNSRHLVIAFGLEGALILSRTSDGHRAHFTFDPILVECESRTACEGDVYGLLSCLASTIALEAARNAGAPDLPSAILQGLAAMRYLLKAGHGTAMQTPAGFPAEAIAAAACDPSTKPGFETREFSCDPASCPVKPGWSLVATPQPPGAAGGKTPLFGMAHQVLSKGLSTLHAPTLKIGEFVTADRGEIEAIRSLKLLISRYLANEKSDKPLSIGVFGTPGSGKSYAVKQLAKSGGFGKHELKRLEFNLSQFNDANDLIGAFHQIRDVVLTGKTPVAFFDEFDAQKFKWLKDLLAPMQDGSFQEGQVSHPIGKCIFIFAGGTSFTYAEFAERAGDVMQSTKVEEEKEFRLLKGSDFASRLDGVLNVVGPNPRRTTPAQPDADIFYPVRRAIFIRENLRCKPEERLVVDPGLATALLEIPAYKNGSRSLTKLLEPFKESRERSPHGEGAVLQPCDLLPADQLGLHVDLKLFNDLLSRDTESVRKLGVDLLASAIHGHYSRNAQATTPPSASQLDADFQKLSAFFQESNRAAARRIPRVLALVGLKLVKGLATPAEEQEIKAIIEFHVDLLGEAEHDYWMDWHVANGWRQSQVTPPVRLNSQQIHKVIVPYADLKEPEKEIDRISVRAYVEVVKLAGMKIVASI